MSLLWNQTAVFLQCKQNIVFLVPLKKPHKQNSSVKSRDVSQLRGPVCPAVTLNESNMKHSLSKLPWYGPANCRGFCETTGSLQQTVGRGLQMRVVMAEAPLSEEPVKSWREDWDHFTSSWFQCSGTLRETCVCRHVHTCGILVFCNAAHCFSGYESGGSTSEQLLVILE